MLIHDPIGVRILQLFSLHRVGRGHEWSPTLGVDHIRVLHAFVHVVHDLKGGTPFFGLIGGLLFDLGHEREFLGISQRDIHAKAWHLDDKRLRHRNRF